MNVLERPVLVLNAHWQPIDEKNVESAVKMLTAENPKNPGYPVAMGMALDEEGNFNPLPWDKWIELKPIYEDYTIHCPNGRVIRAPTVILAANFSKIPLTRPTCCRDEILKRDKYVCAYTNKKYHPSELTIDHVMPKSRGGRGVWTNLVTAHKSVNQQKDNQTPEEAGLKLHFRPREPMPVPKLVRLRPKHKDWEMFLLN